MISYGLLTKCRELKQEVDRYRERLSSIDPAGSISQRYDGMPGSQRVAKPTEDLAMMSVELVEMMQSLISQREEMIRAITTACLGLPSLQRQIVIMRYVDAMSWKEIYLDLHYSKAWVHKQHKDAIYTLTGEDVDINDDI